MKCTVFEIEQVVAKATSFEIFDRPQVNHLLLLGIALHLATEQEQHKSFTVFILNEKNLVHLVWEAKTYRIVLCVENIDARQFLLLSLVGYFCFICKNQKKMQ